jgi:hypothetical protein
VVERAPCSPLAIEPVDGERCPEGSAGGTHTPIERPPAQPVADEPARAAVTGCIAMERTTSGSSAASWEATAHPFDLPERDDSEIQRILANSLQQLSKVVEWHSEPDDSDLSSGLFAQVRLSAQSYECHGCISHSALSLP